MNLFVNGTLPYVGVSLHSTPHSQKSQTKSDHDDACIMTLVSRGIDRKTPQNNARACFDESARSRLGGVRFLFCFLFCFLFYFEVSEIEREKER